MSDVKALDPALLKQYSADFNADRANLVVANAEVSSGLPQLLTTRANACCRMISPLN